MKNSSFILLFALLALQSNAQTFELRLNKVGGSVIAVEMRETSGNPPKTTDIQTDLVFGICWDKNYNINLGSVTTNYTIRKAGPETLKGDLEFQQFAKDPTPMNFPVSWAPNQWVTVMQISTNMAAPQPTGTFFVCPTNIQELNLNYNLVDYHITPAGNAEAVQIGNTAAHTNTEGKRVVQSATGTTETNGHSEWTITPNPSKGDFALMLEALKEEDIQVSVLDVSGKTIYQDVLGVQPGTNRHAIRLNTVSAGVYQVTVGWSDGSTETKNLMISE